MNRVKADDGMMRSHIFPLLVFPSRRLVRIQAATKSSPPQFNHPPKNSILRMVSARCANDKNRQVFEETCRFIFSKLDGPGGFFGDREYPSRSQAGLSS